MLVGQRQERQLAELDQVGDLEALADRDRVRAAVGEREHVVGNVFADRAARGDARAEQSMGDDDRAAVASTAIVTGFGARLDEGALARADLERQAAEQLRASRRWLI